MRHPHPVIYRILAVAAVLMLGVIPYIGIRRKLLAGGALPGWGLELAVLGRVILNAGIIVAVVFVVSAFLGWLLVGRTVHRRPPER